MIYRAPTVNAMLIACQVAIANVVLARGGFLDHDPAQTVGPGNIHPLTISDSGNELLGARRIVSPTVWRCAPGNSAKLAGDG